jgi:riboflavin kinase / FMN adenylyltransferase
MKVYFGFEQWKSSGRTSVSLGNFDGVHLGHQAILQKTVELARKFGISAVAVTFDPVPKKILQPENAPPLIQTLQQRLSSLESVGLDHTIVVKFSESFAQKTPEEFVRQFLVDYLQVRCFVVGENFSFGHQKQGDLSLLKRMGSQYDFEAEGIPEILRNGVRISSSRIRQSILAGKMEDARDFLGSPFVLTGTVVEGEHLGGKLGIPTANLRYENEIIPARGVYVSKAILKDSRHMAATNIGMRPTFAGQNLTVEAHLLDFSGDLYASRMDLQFFHKLRDEMRFSGADALKDQIKSDIEQTRNYLT